MEKIKVGDDKWNKSDFHYSSTINFDSLAHLCRICEWSGNDSSGHGGGSGVLVEGAAPVAAPVNTVNITNNVVVKDQPEGQSGEYTVAKMYPTVPSEDFIPPPYENVNKYIDIEKQCEIQD